MRLERHLKLICIMQYYSLAFVVEINGLQGQMINSDQGNLIEAEAVRHPGVTVHKFGVLCQPHDIHLLHSDLTPRGRTPPLDIRWLLG